MQVWQFGLNSPQDIPSLFMLNKHTVEPSLITHQQKLKRFKSAESSKMKKLPLCVSEQF